MYYITCFDVLYSSMYDITCFPLTVLHRLCLRQVGRSEIFAHRAVLACASPYFYELFSAEDEQKSALEGRVSHGGSGERRVALSGFHLSNNQ